MGKLTKVGIASALLAIALGFGTPYALPVVLEWCHPDITFRFKDRSRTLYLTIDDSPSTATGEILEVLKKHHVHATFFVIGSWVHSDSQLQQIADAGCSLGNHMWTTQRCSTLPFQQFRAEFDSTDALLRRFPRSGEFFRPPSDFGTRDQLNYVSTAGRRPIVGTVFPIDSSISAPAILTFLVKWLTVPGGVLIMHDGARRGKITAQVLDVVLPYLQARGYQVLALSPDLANPSPEDSSYATLKQVQLTHGK